MAVQDDRRENEMCKLLGLRKGEGRSDIDAFLDFQVGQNDSFSVPIELKSTTNTSVSTARDVGSSHIQKWRSRIWVFGFYDASGRTLKTVLTLGPKEMEPWIGKIESYIAPDFSIGERVVRKLDIEDLHVICGEKDEYTLQDAQALYKRQWDKQQYLSQMDRPSGYSPKRMLDILKLRAKYLNERGSTLNNPHIPMAFFSRHSMRMIDVIKSDVAHVAEHTQKEIMRFWVELNRGSGSR